MNNILKFKSRWKKIIKMYSLSDKVDQDYLQKIEDIIIKSYSEEHRFYHNLDHINNCIDVFFKIKYKCRHSLNVLFAILFHDIVYKIGADDNEEQSAQLMYSYCNHLTIINAVSVYAYIVNTKDHLITGGYDNNIVQDIDLSILGSSSKLFMQYDNSIQLEYCMYADKFQESRLKFLESIDVDNIYASPYFKEQYGSNAINNIKGLIQLYKIDKVNKN